ncbi:RNA polymerase sigma-70 factor [Nakamurella deserti]|uniref:RNA polymerase sigma-70 factor n=1 Tax=Nakamurella deserti TaxID=2164074 RepID=UPI000DBE0046|nr:RNA polymerase sigma-70 factor [Nakamurella deserti]
MSAAERRFTEHRSLLFTVAYEMLGSAADAEDVVQEVWVRWSAAHADAGATGADEIVHPRAYLVRITTRLALNRMRTTARRREDYIGPWLPEPLLTVPDVLDDVVLAESVSMALLVVLESLAPPERAVFVLREVFGYDYDEIAAAVDKSPAAVRQIAHRARAHVQARRPRFDTDPQVVRQVMTGFQQSLHTGDVQGLMDLMAPEVVLLSDGGGKRQAARNPVVGPWNVARFMVGIAGKADPDTVLEVVQVNGAPAWRITTGAALYGVFQLVVADGLIRQLLLVANPDKLSGLSGGVGPLDLPARSPGP